MEHTYICSPHWHSLEGDEACECDDPESGCCNMYWVSGYCPTEGKGPLCLHTDNGIPALENLLSDALEPAYRVADPWLRDDDEEREHETIIVMGTEIEL